MPIAHAMAKHTVINGLIRALCPSIDAKFLSKPFHWPWSYVGCRQYVTCLRRTRPSGSYCASQHHALHSGLLVRSAWFPRQQLPPPWAASVVSFGSPLAVLQPAHHRRAYTVGSTQKQGQKRHQNRWWRKKNPKRKKEKNAQPRTSAQAKDDPALGLEEFKELHEICLPWIPFAKRPRRIRTSTIYKTLRRLRKGSRVADKIRWIVSHLIKCRHQPPNMRLYEAMVVANWDTTRGSASELAGMYKELRASGMKPSSTWYSDGLRLLAIHPDYLMRNTLLERMKEEGVRLTDKDRMNVALGLLRDGQHEMALDYWDEMVKDKVNISSWLAEIFIFVMVLRGFLDEAVDLVMQALESKMLNLSRHFQPLWAYLLDECSRWFHYEGTRLMWDKMVSEGHITPPDGVVLNVLNTAARHGDSALATSAIELLASRDVKLGPHHYEPLLESYVHAGSLGDALRVLGIMRDAGLQPDQSSTRAIYLALKQSPERVGEAVEMLKELGPNPPAAAVNVVLEAAAKTSGDMERTLDVYRQICEQCAAAPNQQTFALLLAECRSNEPAVFLLHEMDRYSVRPSHAILDNLIRCFAVDGNLSVALAYLDEMGRLSSVADARMWVSKRTLKAVLSRCYREKHPSMWRLLEEAKRRGMKVGDWMGEAS